jgi:thiol-disulfide isomerase/thioredoxin
MNILLVVAAMVGLVTVAGADDPMPARDVKEPVKPQKPPVSLKGGDKAPPLKVTTWLQGAEVKEFEAGKVYIVEFWATWCGPCIAYMPHLAAIQAEYKEKGVTVIGFTSRDILGKPEHTEKMVAAFVKDRGPKLKYTFAWADDQDTNRAWMGAAGREGIPCTFVVDKTGRIAYIGHPLYLPLVVPKVVTGTEGARAISDEMAKVEAEYASLSGDLARDPKAGLQALKAFEAKYPPLTDFVPSVRAKLSYLPKYGAAGEAKEYSEALVAQAVKRNDRLNLSMVSAILRLGDGKEDKELLALAVKAAEAEVGLTAGVNAQALINLASTYAAAGDVSKAKEYARKAVEAAAGEPAALKEFIEREARQLSDAKPGDRK